MIGRRGQRTARPRAAANWTTRRWLRVGVTVAFAVLALLGGLGAWAMARSATITSDLVDTRSPALTNSVRLETALVNQETGIRGYGLTGQKQFLQPYQQGVKDEKAAADRLGRLLVGDRPALADLHTVLDRAGAWQRRIAAPIAAARPGAPVPSAGDRSARGKADFDRLRQAMTTQQSHLLDARRNAVGDLERAQKLRDWIFIAIAAVIILLAAVVSEGLRRGVTGPLTRLSADAGRVTRGDFAHRITASGPADLRTLGTDIESMRRRLADELALSEQRRQLLDEQAVDLKRSNEELEQFAYIASHDLQEPLRKVSSFTQLLQRRYRGQLDDRADQYISYAVDGANRMQVLINDLLAFSRIGRVHNALDPVDLHTVLDKTLDTLSISIEEAGARITREDLPTVAGDTTQLGMLWQNLISNAIKFRAPERTPEIHIGVRQGDGLWQFTVTDNGIGIEPEYADRVFVIFQRLHTKDRYPGSGIGLAMCKKIVEHHGGTIRVEPTAEPGTRIAFTLPDTPPADAHG
ncbi:ATP-binding protein [Streptomyces sp. NPDC048664]|uniref:sensor histidine kinase n=1 Tax=Streptomyces sp. NPDC048664 TaxID=3154505 RepID=UPI003438D716